MPSISIKEIGSFYVGGICEKQVAINPNAENGQIIPIPLRKNNEGFFVRGQMYVHYVKLKKSIAKYPLLFIHGGGLTGVCWESTPDGREGWQMFFLRRGHDVYVSDAVERGRASWAYCKEMYPNPPIFVHMEHLWKSFRIGPIFNIDPDKRECWPGSQFPVEHLEDFLKQNVPRWMDTFCLIKNAYIEYFKKMKNSVLLVHSQGAYMALEAVLKVPGSVKGIIMIEPSALYWPQINENDLKELAKIPQLLIFGDFLETSEIWQGYLEKLRIYQKDIKAFGGIVDWINLPELGIRGNSHMIMMDRNNFQVAEIVQKWMEKQGFYPS